MHVRDSHATLPAAPDSDREKLTCRAQGLHFKLAGVKPASLVGAPPS